MAKVEDHGASWSVDMLHSGRRASSHSSLGSRQLPQVLTVPSMVGLIFFEVCGGAYGIEPVVGKAGNPWLAVLGLVVTPMVWSAPIALMTAEMCSAFPHVGGKIYFVTRTFGPYIGWLHGAFNAVSNVFDVATVPALALAYAKQLGVEAVDELAPYISCLMIFSACMLNIRGIEVVGTASFVFTILVCSPFVVFVLLGARGLPNLPTDPFLVKPTSPLKFLSCLLWNMSGYDDAGATAAEIKNPQEVYPTSLAISLVVITSTYLMPVLVGLTVVPSTSEWHDGAFVQISSMVGGSILGGAVALLGVVSSFGQLNALLCSSVREIVCMAELPGQPVPRTLASLHPRYLTPHVATMAFSCLLFLLVDVTFTDLIAASMFFDCFSFVIQFAAWVKHRADVGNSHSYIPLDDENAYRAPFGFAAVVAVSALPVACCVAAVLLTLVEKGIDGFVGFASTLAVSSLMFVLQPAETRLGAF